MYSSISLDFPPEHIFNTKTKLSRFTEIAPFNTFVLCDFYPMRKYRVSKMRCSKVINVICIDVW